MTDEQYVRNVWERRMRLIEPAPGHWVITNFDEIYNGAVVSWPKTPAQNWAAAADFTRQRLEKIREIEEERAMLCGTMLCGKVLLEDNDIAIVKRILARLEAEHARLTTGIKPEVLEKK